MIISYLKIWFNVVMKHVNINIALKTILIYILYFAIIFLLTSFNLYFSIFIFFNMMIFILVSRLILLFRELTKSGKYDLLLLRPVDPLFGLLIYNKNPADILILVPVLIFIKFKNYNK